MKRIIGFDWETFLIRPGLPIPPGVCVSWAEGDREGLFDHARGVDFLEACLNNPDIILVAHNLSYDLGITVRERPHLLRPVIRALEQGRLRCTLVRQKLIDISNGEHKFYRDANGKIQKTYYDLAVLVKRHFDRFLPKADTWRLRYGELFGMDPLKYPKDAYDYAIRDAREALDVFLSQQKTIELDEGEEWPGTMPDEIRQTCAQFALHLMHAWGFRADPERVAKLKKEALEIRNAAYEKLLAWGLVRWGGTKKAPKLVKSMAAIRKMIEEVYTEADLDVPMTDPSPKFPDGQVATDKETLEYFSQYEGEGDEKKPVEGFYDPRCEALLEASGNILTTWVPALEEACRRPSNPGYNVLVESGRTSCSKGSDSNPSCNIQNPPRKGDVRSCIKARPGFVFADADYDTLELRTLSQVCLDLFGHSAMAEAIKAGEDPHSSYAAARLDIPYEDFLKLMKEGDKEAEEARQAAKPANFGFPGGLGAKTYVAYARGYKVFLTLEEAKAAQAFFKKRWPEMNAYFRFIAQQTELDAPAEQLRSGRVRGRVRYTARANTYFQGLAADGAKAAMWALIKECYLGEDTIGDLNGAESPLAGSRPIMFIHDQFITEVPEWRAHEAAMRQKRVMEHHMTKWIPDVGAKASVVLTRYWYKGAKPVTVNGKMVPSKPEKVVGPDGKEKVKWVPDLEPVAQAA